MNLFNIYIFYFLCDFSIAISNKHSGVHHHGSSSESGKIAQQMCEKYTSQACRGYPSPRRLKQPYRNYSYYGSKRSVHGSVHSSTGIVGGVPAHSKQFPHMAMIGADKYKHGKWHFSWYCGGSLISESFVLSAAHCTRQNPTTLRLGELDYSIKSDHTITIDLGIREIIVHPRYQEAGINDIALFRFRPVPAFTEYYRPICLNTVRNIPSQHLVAVGWGSYSYYGGPTNPRLHSVELELRSTSLCNTKSDYDDITSICVGSHQGKSTCSGDSGGPLQITNNPSKCSRVPIYTQIGITSWGEDCGKSQFPTIFTRVSYYIGWIESIVWK